LTDEESKTNIKRMSSVDEYLRHIQQSGFIVVIWAPTANGEVLQSEDEALRRMVTDPSLQACDLAHDPPNIKVGHAALVIYPGVSVPYRYVSFWPSNPEEGSLLTTSSLHSYEYDCQLEEGPPHFLIPLLGDVASTLKVVPDQGEEASERYQLFSAGSSCNCATYVQKVLSYSKIPEFEIDKSPSSLASSSEDIRPTTLRDKAIRAADRIYTELQGTNPSWADKIPHEITALLSAVHPLKPSAYYEPKQVPLSAQRDNTCILS
jgi:hypothetical protein